MYIGNTLGRRGKSSSSPASTGEDVGAASRLYHPQNPNPLGDADVCTSSPNDFSAATISAAKSEAIPAWQRDLGQVSPTSQTASLERQSILKALTRLDKFGVIFDRSGAIVQGNSGWTRHLKLLPTLSVNLNTLVPASILSQQDLCVAINLLFDNYGHNSVPVLLRDLDGWVCDVMQIKRVGLANPNYAYAILPKSPENLSASFADMAQILGLTPSESVLLGLIVSGETDLEIASALNMKQRAIKAAIRHLVGKFQVRRKSDIVRLLASFP